MVGSGLGVVGIFGGFDGVEEMGGGVLVVACVRTEH